MPINVGIQTFKEDQHGRQTPDGKNAHSRNLTDLNGGGSNNGHTDYTLYDVPTTERKINPKFAEDALSEPSHFEGETYLQAELVARDTQGTKSKSNTSILKKTTKR